MKHIPTPADMAIVESQKQLKTILNSLELTDLERGFVENASTELANLAWDLLMEVPDEDRMRMRGLITSVAIARFLCGIEGLTGKELEH